jgi:hypothetical protein
MTDELMSEGEVAFHWNSVSFIFPKESLCVIG